MTASFEQQPSPLPTPVAPIPPALQPGVTTLQIVPLDVLLAQEVALQQQLTSLQARVNELGRQVRRMEGDARSETQAQLSQMNLQAADTRASLSSVRAQINARLSSRVAAGQTAGFPFQRRQDYIPGEAAVAMAIVFIVAVLMPLSIGITRRLWRRGAPVVKPAEDAIAPRLDRLEHAVDAIAIEIERVSEGQRFMTKVMTERPAVSTVLPSPSAQVADESALGEGKPFLALGAGPIEPIPVVQRQAVRQSITPH